VTSAADKNILDEKSSLARPVHPLPGAQGCHELSCLCELSNQETLAKLSKVSGLRGFWFGLKR